ncbi:hypothetical protein [Serratia ficaria]|uniref:hypothetical protein n=1 Tax=Serratia ficaria TaxID=61651 RepID=UPI00077C21E0|nr:hypothetical protein [Serratia ficaria]
MDNKLRKLKAELRQILDGDDMDCVSDRTGNSDDYCAGFVDGMNDALNQLAVGIGTLLEEKDKRIAELERITEGVDQLAIDGGWTARGMSEYAKSLEARLATPVSVPSFDCYKPDVARELQEGFKNTVRAAGFTVEGDE